MKKKFITLFLLFFGFVLFFKFSSVDVNAEGPTFRLISAERFDSFDRYTFSCSSKGYGLGFAGNGNESYLIINGNIELNATSSMASNNYTRFVITDTDLKLNSKIQSMEFTNVLTLNDSNLPSGSKSGNPSYNIDYSNATFTGFSFYSSSKSSSSSSMDVKSGFNVENISQYIPIAVFLILWSLFMIIMSSTMKKMSNEKVLTYAINKKAYIKEKVFGTLCVFLWFGTSAFACINFFEDNMVLCVAHLFGGFLLNSVSLFLVIKSFGSRIDKKANSIKKLSAGMSRDEVIDTLEVELDDNNKINLLKLFRSGSEKTSYSLSFDENNKLVSIDGKSIKKWTETYYM